MLTVVLSAIKQKSKFVHSKFPMAHSMLFYSIKQKTKPEEKL